MTEANANESVMTQLEHWANDIRINPDHFDCSYFNKCNESIKHKLQRGHGCCMSYIGPQYEEGFRLVIVGMDHGQPDSTGATFQKRQQEILDYRNNPENKFNQHYAGVVKTAAAILGKSGCYCRDHCSKSCQGGDNGICVLNRIAQPNLVKCAPPLQPDSSSMSTWTMKTYCARHLLSELRILQPQMIVFHGADSRSIMLEEFRQHVDLIPVIDGNNPENRVAKTL